MFFLKHNCVISLHTFSFTCLVIYNFFSFLIRNTFFHTVYSAYNFPLPTPSRSSQSNTVNNSSSSVPLKYKQASKYTHSKIKYDRIKANKWTRIAQSKQKKATKKICKGKKVQIKHCETKTIPKIALSLFSIGHLLLRTETELKCDLCTQWDYNGKD